MVALVRGVHGLNGAVRAEVLTDRPQDRFAVGGVLFREGDARPLTIAAAEEIVDGPGWRLRFREVTSRDGADTLRGAYLESIVVPDQDLARGSYYWHEVVGCAVRGTDGTDLGTVRDIYRIGETEVFTVDGSPFGSFDLPAVRAFIRVFAPRRGEIVVDAESLDLRPRRSRASDPDRPKAPRRRTRRTKEGAEARGLGGGSARHAFRDRRGRRAHRSSRATRAGHGRMTLDIDVLTLFPAMLDGPLAQSIPGRIQEQGLASVRIHDLRGWGIGRHRSVDDAPYGGGAGMILRPEPVAAALDALRRDETTVILLDPIGEVFRQARAADLVTRSHLIFVCPRYEGVDERIRSLVDLELSIGDYVLTGGELPALVVIDAVIRLLPGAIEAASVADESFSDGLLEYPQYTRPAVFRGMGVPAVLTSGDHGAVERWRREQALERTRERRPDLTAGD